MIIYKTTNKINGKIYVGKDVAHQPKYLGSGLLLDKAIKKYGRENFYKETIEVCSSIDELNEREIYWIKTLNATDKKIGYNIAEGGTGGNTWFGKSQKEKDLIIEKRRSTLEKKYIDNPKLKELYHRKLSEKSRMMWTPEHVELMRNKMLGRKITWDTGLSKNRHSGIVSEEHREKLRKSSIGREFVKVDAEIETLMVNLYKECGPKRMQIS